MKTDISFGRSKERARATVVVHNGARACVNSSKYNRIMGNARRSASYGGEERKGTEEDANTDDDEQQEEE